MKKRLAYFFLMLLFVALAGCGNQATQDKQNDANDKQIEAHNLSAMQKMPEFKLKDLNGNEVSNAIFAENELNLIKIWGTFCGPCIDEIPDLQALYQEMKGQGVNVIGVVSDGMGNESLAQQISKQQGAQYISIIPDQKFIDDFVSRTDVVPVSIMVNSQGERVGEVIVGSRSQQEYRELIEATLKK